VRVVSRMLKYIINYEIIVHNPGIISRPYEIYSRLRMVVQPKNVADNLNKIVKNY
jgi:hypothetical protein